MVRASTEQQATTGEAQHRRRLIGISLLPAAATLGNLLCGFLAVFCCMLALRAGFAHTFAIQPRLEQLFPTHISAGAYLVILAMIFDALDGRLARITRRTSEFGAQLDSISDIVSFGIAPAALFVTVLLRPALGTETEVLDSTRIQVQIGMLAAMVYVSCAAIRLARYNAENVKSEEAQHKFSGLPSPGAAGAMVALLILHESVRESGFDLWNIPWAGALRWLIAATAFATGLLMVSRIDYVHVFNVYVRRRRPPTDLVWLLLIVAVGWYCIELVLVVIAFTYVLSGPVRALVSRIRGRPA
jgi:CDP-diacylglycerol--serine O-phosphatidyltransferase